MMDTGFDRRLSPGKRAPGH